MPPEPPLPAVPLVVWQPHVLTTLPFTHEAETPHVIVLSGQRRSPSLQLKEPVHVEPRLGEQAPCPQEHGGPPAVALLPLVPPPLVPPPDVPPFDVPPPPVPPLLMPAMLEAPPLVTALPAVPDAPACVEPAPLPLLPAEAAGAPELPPLPVSFVLPEHAAIARAPARTVHRYPNT